MRTLLLLILLTPATVGAQPVPDRTFADDGFALVKLRYTSYPNAAAIAPDGSTVLAISSASDAFLARLLPDGSPDPLLGPSGGVRVLPPEDATLLTLNGVVVLPDGRIAAVGGEAGGAPGGGYRTVVALFHRDGRPDSTFSGDGFARNALVSATYQHGSQGYAIAYHEGHLIVTAAVGSRDYSPALIARLALNGALDPTFGTGGVVTVRGEGDSQERNVLRDVAVFPDGRVIAVGYREGSRIRPFEDRTDAMVVRLDERGAPDGANGLRLYDVFPLAHDEAYGVSPLADGRSLVSGITNRRYEDGGGRGVTLFRLAPDGSPDPAFGSGGRTWTSTFPPPYTTVVPGKPFLGADGGAVVPVGTAADVDGFAVLVLDASGAPDPSAGPGGIARLFVDRPSLQFTGSSTLADGRFVTFGWQYDNGLATPFVARAIAPRSVTTGAEPAEHGFRIAPNPAASSARVSLSLGPSADARVTVLDALGRTVAVLHDGPLASGETTLTLDASALPAGVYAVVAVVGPERSVTRLTVVR